jgi:hypothetical protein
MARHTSQQLLYLLKIDVITQLHVLRMDAKNLQTASRVWNTDVDFTIETAKATKGRVNGVWPVGSSHDNNIGPSLQTVHKSEQLRYNATLDFTVRL